MDEFLKTISRSLGRESVPSRPLSDPPVLDERIARLVGPDAPLLERFVSAAEGSKLVVMRVERDRIVGAIAKLLRDKGLTRAVVARSGLLATQQLVAGLRGASIEALGWDETSLDATYDCDVGVTDVWMAIAETGSLVVRGTEAHARALSLVPPVHVAVVERGQIVPDLIDAMQRIKAEGTGSGVVMITGPSKTADIEMNLVTGVHGPGEVYVFVVVD